MTTMTVAMHPGQPARPAHTVTLHVPSSLYEHVQRAAEALQRPLEEVLLEALATALPPLVGLPEEIADDLATLPFLNDAALFQIMANRLPADVHDQTDALLGCKGRGEISSAEQQRLDELVHAHEVLALRRAQAALLLQRRGYDMSDPARPARLP